MRKLQKITFTILSYISVKAATLDMYDTLLFKIKHFTTEMRVIFSFLLTVKYTVEQV